MASSDSNWPNFLKACVPCFPRKPKKPTYPEFYTVPYNNAQSGPEPFMSGALPERTPRSNKTTGVEYDRDGQASIRLQRLQHLSVNQSPSTLTRPTTASSANTTRQRFPVNTGNVYGIGNTDPRDRWSKAYLTPRQFAELLDNIHDTLQHIPYAICGLAALNDYGYVTRRLNAVSLVCPFYAKDNVRGWLRTKGYDMYDDYFGIPIGDRGYGGEGATIYRVRVKWVNDEGFAKLKIVKSSTSNALVLSLADQTDYCAMGFMHQLRLVEELKASAKEQGGAEQAQAVARAESRLRMAAQDILWCLDKAARTSYRFDPEHLPTLLGERCWTAFTTHSERARTEMARAGIDVAAVLRKHRDQKEVRDHEAMLRRFGVGTTPGLVTRQPSPFEGMRTLANPRTAYGARHGRGEATTTIPESPLRSALDPAHLARKPLPSTPGDDDAGKNRGMLPRRGENAREKAHREWRDKFPKIGAPILDGRDLTLARSRSVRPPPRDPALVQLPRQSAEMERRSPEWI